MRRGLKAVGGRIDMGPDNLNNLADLFATAILEDAFTPKQEDEADKEGLKMACHAGYEPAASFRVMDRFDKAGVGLASKDKYAHKSAVQRKEYLQKLVASEKFADGGSTNAERYRRSLPR
jgi:predicted Zn-dependent protease